jgi:hypothetical protein
VWVLGVAHAGGRRRVCLKSAALVIVSFVLVGTGFVAQTARSQPRVLAQSTVAPTADSLQFTLHVDRLTAPEIAGKRIATFAQAVRAFGHPPLVAPTVARPPACKASWPMLGLEIIYSASRPSSCTASDLGSWAQITGRTPRWHTRAGLRVGDSEQRLDDLYPQARLLDFLGQGRMRELETGGLVCDGGPTLALAGLIRSARVTALTIVHVPACG